MTDKEFEQILRAGELHSPGTDEQVLPGVTEERLGEVLTAALDRIGKGKPFSVNRAATLAGKLFKAGVLVPDEPLLRVIEEQTALPLYQRCDFPLAAMVDWIERRMLKGDVSVRLLTGLRKHLPGMLRHPLDKTHRALSRRMMVALELATDCAIPAVSDAWTAVALAWRETLTADAQWAWDSLLELARDQTSSKPSKTYHAAAAAILTSLPLFPEVMHDILEAIGREGPVGVPFRGYQTNDRTRLHEDFTDLLRALIWVCPSVPELVDPLRSAAVRCNTKIPGIGPLSAKIAAACSYALSRQESDAGARAIFELQTSVKHKSTRKSLEKAIAGVEENRGMSRDALEEGIVPTLGFSTGSMPCLQLEGETFFLQASRSAQPQLFRKGNAGEMLPFKPSGLGISDSGKALLKELKRVWRSEVARLERMLRNDRQIPFKDWKKHYMDHPIVGTLSRLMHWRVGGALVAWQRRKENPTGYEMVMADGSPFLPTGNELVSLWHPAELSAHERQIWERWVLDRRVTQPFQQAMRATYLLDEGGGGLLEDTRFAGERMDQGVFAALCRQRGWEYSFHGGPTQFEPCIKFPRWALRCGLRVKEDFSTPAKSLRKALSLEIIGLRFVSTSGNSVVPLGEVPPVLLSEVLRDVDLFLAATVAAR